MSVTPQPPLYVEMEKCLVMVEVTMVVLMQTHAILKAQLVLTSATLLLQLFVGLTRPYLVMEDPLLAAPIQIHVIQKVLNVHRSATVLLR